MMPASTLLPLATASDADVREFLSSDKLQQFLPTLDDFFSCATTLQTQESNKTHEASVHALQTETRAVFSLFLRLLDAPGLLALGLNCGVLHVTRLVPFCQLPRRRILPAMLIDDLAAENKPKATLSANAKEWTASESSAAIAAADGETKAPAPQTNESATSFEPMVNQVKDFFPDLGEGFVELCLLSSGLQVEVVINFLLESNPPPVLIDVPQDLKRSDPDFERLEAQITGKPAPAAKVSREEPKKLDPSRVWENRRMRAKEEKDAFWEGMKNRNRENHANGADAEDAGDEEKAETKS
ncbi:hypothetical protein JM18_009353, partial [Phytophthora kernoviae]